MRLKGKVAIITGAGVGIGRASALLFAKEGAAVAVVDRNAETGRETVERITREGGKAIFIHADVSQTDAVQRMFQETLAGFGKLNILFNNAGIVVQGRVEDTSEAEWDEQIATTLTSVFLCCKYGIPILRAQGGGVIINMSSVTGVMGVVNRAAYSAAKGGVAALTRAIALDHAQEQIRAVFLAPATIETPSLQERIRTAPDPVAARKAFEARQPIGRIGKPEDVAYAALYLASDEAAFVTGCGLAVDGGMAV
ncbi:MAG TPA: glucose 1-dehydrogenase [Chthonomonadaceae bacterium]|nr:glucose 1-dehydrogenase [Chthonomonadaceae bacterium]